MPAAPQSVGPAFVSALYNVPSVAPMDVGEQWRGVGDGIQATDGNEAQKNL